MDDEEIDLILLLEACERCRGLGCKACGSGYTLTLDGLHWMEEVSRQHGFKLEVKKHEATG